MDFCDAELFQNTFRNSLVTVMTKTKSFFASLAEKALILFKHIKHLFIIKEISNDFQCSTKILPLRYRVIHSLAILGHDDDLKASVRSTEYSFDETWLVIFSVTAGPWDLTFIKSL